MTAEGNCPRPARQVGAPGVAHVCAAGRKVRGRCRSIAVLGRALTADQAARRVAGDLERSVRRVRELVAGRSRPRVLYLIWTESADRRRRRHLHPRPSGAWREAGTSSGSRPAPTRDSTGSKWLAAPPRSSCWPTTAKTVSTRGRPRAATCRRSGMPGRPFRRFARVACVPFRATPSCGPGPGSARA